MDEAETTLEIEYVSADLLSQVEDPALKQFQDIFAKFASPEELTQVKKKACVVLSPDTR